jgi:DNA-binding XRE family transcriptional regulator
MDIAKQKKLEDEGWKVSSTSEFLGLSIEEELFIELKLSLSKQLREIRESHQVTQKALAKRIQSSQSRVAKMESGDPSVSIDLLIRALLSMGATSQDIAQAISQV